jgi:porphobilinogen synthase
MTFPIVRMRRLRRTPLLRNLVAETQLSLNQLVYPLFVTAQEHVRIPVPSMPGIDQLSLDLVVQETEKALKLGVRSVLLFGIPEEKDQAATSAWAEDGIVQRTVKALKKEFANELIVITDTCLCEYMTHGHCGIVMEGRVLNDPSLDVLARVAVSQAEAGADMVAPSDMMDGRVGWLRQSLDEAGYVDTPIMAYSAKYASHFYSPFRDAANSAPAFGDRRSYQMDPRNRNEAMQEVLLDLQEGADIVMVKPALSYLDVLFQVKQSVNMPVAAYSVSGEYSMIKAASERGWIDERSIVMETTMAMRRAGADIIITYHALDIARWLGEDS